MVCMYVCMYVGCGDGIFWGRWREGGRRIMSVGSAELSVLRTLEDLYFFKD